MPPTTDRVLADQESNSLILEKRNLEVRKMRAESGQQPLPWGETTKPILNLPTDEKHEGWHTLHGIFCRDTCVPINIHLYNLKRSCILASDLVQDRFHRLTWLTPGCGETNQYWEI